MMAQRCFSVCFKPLSHQITLWTFRSTLYSRSSYMTCGRYPQTSCGDVSSHWLSTCRNALVQSTRVLGSSSAVAKTGEEKEFRLIYKFRGIRLCRAVSKLKILQTALTFTFLPPIYYFYLQGQIPQLSAVYFSGLALFACVMLYSLSYYLRRIVGMMYTNKDATTLKVAHLTFWGNRKDICFPVDDLKRLSETGDSKGEILLRLKRYSSPDTFYFTLRYGQVLDKETFSLIFGDI